jgi:manganese transport protein
MHWRIRPWVRRMVTRLLAIVRRFSSSAPRENSVNDLLTLSQVISAYNFRWQ